MNNLIDFHKLRQVDSDIYEHLYELYVDHRPSESQHLGYVNKATDCIEISLEQAQIDLNIRQSLSALSSSKESSSTGFICWQAAVKLADWILGDEKCPFHKPLTSKSDLVVLELGTGVGAILVSLFGPKVGQYIATDQKHILKLLKENFTNNVVSQRYTSSTMSEEHEGGPHRGAGEKWSEVDFIEFDWEHLEEGAYNFNEISKGRKPDLILASDTIYNGYLIPFFVKAFKCMMAEDTGVLISMQLRDESILEQFLERVSQEDLKLYTIPDEYLSTELIEGFVVYYITK